MENKKITWFLLMGRIDLLRRHIGHRWVCVAKSSCFNLKRTGFTVEPIVSYLLLPGSSFAEYIISGPHFLKIKYDTVWLRFEKVKKGLFTVCKGMCWYSIVGGAREPWIYWGCRLWNIIECLEVMESLKHCLFI